MPGPGVAAYLILSVILFATGAFGVLIRRSPLIVLLALEIMLNAGNLALIAFARQTGTGTGQIFALTVMVVAAPTAGVKTKVEPLSELVPALVRSVTVPATASGPAPVGAAVVADAFTE